MSSNAIPNLDCMTQAELRAFWKRYHRPTRKDAAALIGDKRKGYTRIAQRLAAYAMAKNCAMGLRLEGEINRANVYESHCDGYYVGLPEDCRW